MRLRNTTVFHDLSDIATLVEALVDASGGIVLLPGSSIVSDHFYALAQGVKEIKFLTMEHR